MQRSDEWFRQRRGRLTASMLGQALGLTPWGSPQSLATALRKDTLPRDPDSAPCADTGGNVATRWGTENEPNALLEYMCETATHVQETGFWQHPTLTWFGGSPDGLIGDSGILEIKCPFTKRLYPTIPLYYYCQVNALLEITNRDWCDLYVWTPTASRLWRIQRNASAFAALTTHYARFFACVNCEALDVPNPSADVKPLLEQWIAQDALEISPHDPLDPCIATPAPKKKMAPSKKKRAAPEEARSKRRKKADQ